MDTNAKRDMVTIYDANGQIVSVIAKDNVPMPKWTRKASTGKGTVLDAQGNVVSVNVPVTHDKSGHGPVAVHDSTDKGDRYVADITSALTGDMSTNPYCLKASTDKGTSGEGKHISVLHKFRKATLQCALFQLMGKSFEHAGNVLHVSAMDKTPISQLLRDKGVKIVDIEAMLFSLVLI